MANLNKTVDGKLIELTDEEQAQYDAQQKAVADNAPNRRMAMLRKKRDALLKETDWMALGDVTMSDSWKTYRQALRDITTQIPSDEALTNIKWPTKPS